MGENLFQVSQSLELMDSGSFHLGLTPIEQFNNANDNTARAESSSTGSSIGSVPLLTSTWPFVPPTVSGSSLRPVEAANNIDIAQLMDNNRRSLDNNETLHESSDPFESQQQYSPVDCRVLRVPGDGFSDTTTTETEVDNIDMNIHRWGRKHDTTDANVPVKHPLSVKRSYCHK